MKIFYSLIAVAVMVFPQNGAGATTGKWAPLFQGENFGVINEAYAARDCLWFISDSGVGRIYLPTKEFTFFGSALFGVGVNFKYRLAYLAATDSGNAAVYSSGQLFVYASGKWTSSKIERPVWKVKMYGSGRVYLACDTVLYTYHGSGLDSIVVHLNHPSEGRSIFDVIEDAFDTVWITSRYAGQSYLYRFEGSALQAIQVPGKFSKTDTELHLLLDGSGTLRVYAKNTLLSVKDNQLTVDYSFKDTAFADYVPIIDPDGNFCYLAYRSGSLMAMKAYLPKSDSLRRDPAPDFGSLVTGEFKFGSFASQMVLVESYGYWYYSQESGGWKFVSIRTLAGNGCADRSPPGIPAFHFERDGSFLLAGSGGGCFRHSGEECFDMPALPGYPNCLFALSNGSIAAGTSIGLYYFDETRWTKDSALGNVPVKKIVQDAKGRIWGITDDFIFRQKDSLWEQIDSRNTNIPALAKFQFLGIASNNTVWVKMSGIIAKTTDGYTWTIYDRTNSILQGDSVLEMDIDKNDRVSAVWREKYDAATLQTILVQAFYNGSNWVAEDTVAIPGTLILPENMFRDRRGDLWVPSTVPISGPRLYQISKSKVVIHDSSTTPFFLGVIVAEDPVGKLYAVTTSGLMVYDHDAVNAVHYFPRGIPGATGILTAGTVGAKRYVVNYALQNAGMITLTLYSSQGRLIRTLASGYCRQGAHRCAFDLKSSSGIYFVRLSTPAGNRVVRMAVK
jgi:hypothetical protein